MSDNIHVQADGRAAVMVTRVPAWHRLGQVIMKDAVTWEEAMNEALLDWTVSKVQLAHPLREGAMVDAWGIFRDDTQEFLGVTGKDYRPLQNEYAFEFVDAILEAAGEAHYVTAGALGQGEKIWCLAQIGSGFEVVPGDKHETYLLFTTSHDRSQAATCKVVTTRVVCQNTLSMALGEQGAFLKIRHTSNMDRKMEQAKKLVTGATMQVQDIEDKLRTLATRRLSQDSYMTIMTRLFGDAETGMMTKMALDRITEVTTLFDKNDGKEGFKEVYGTAYGLLNAITEHTDHFRQTFVGTERNDEARASSALFNSGAKLKEQALEVILETTTGDEVVESRLVQVPEEVGPSKKGILDDIISETQVKYDI